MTSEAARTDPMVASYKGSPLLLPEGSRRRSCFKGCPLQLLPGLCHGAGPASRLGLLSLLRHSGQPLCAYGSAGPLEGVHGSHKLPLRWPPYLRSLSRLPEQLARIWEEGAEDLCIEFFAKVLPGKRDSLGIQGWP